MLKTVPALLLCTLCACSTLTHKDGTPDASSLKTEKKKFPSRPTRNNAASLLYDLLNNEKDVSKVLIIKSATPELTQLIKSIADAARDGIKTLDALAAADHSLHLDRVNMPPGDAAARTASAKTSQRVILHSAGKDFEFQLLLTQVQAMDYGAQLCKVAAANEANPERARQFSALGNQLQNLYQLVTDRLRTSR